MISRSLTPTVAQCSFSFSFLGEKRIKIWVFYITINHTFSFWINYLHYYVKLTALISLPLNGQGALVSAGQVFSFLAASSFGPPLISCSGRSWRQQMLNKAEAFLRPRCRGGQEHCPKPVEEGGKGMAWNYIFNINGT